MQTHIQKWGNSLGVRIPALLSSQLKLKAGSPIDITVKDDHIVIFPQKCSLQNILDRITEDNIHTSVRGSTKIHCDDLFFLMN